jgi:predicted ATPase
MAESEERWADAELHRARGELLGAAQNPAGAEHCFGKALAVATQQGTKFWELRAAVSMARLWRNRVGTLDLKQARTLLDELA